MPSIPVEADSERRIVVRLVTTLESERRREPVDLKEMAASKDLKVGTCVMEFISPGIGKIVKQAGADFVFFDMEHNGYSFDSLNHLLRFFEAADLPLLLRPPSKSYHHVAHALDLGARALLLPHIRSAEEARQILDWMRYPPEGSRGVALGIAHDNYRPAAHDEVMGAANREIGFFVTLENADGLAEVEEIAAIDGVDGLVLGHNDLSSSLGVAGRWDNPTFAEAVDRVAAACAAHGKSYGRLVTTPKEGQELFDTGADLIICSGDIWLFMDALRSMIDDVRDLCRGEAGAARG